jgi:hypothetical protein
MVWPPERILPETDIAKFEVDGHAGDPNAPLPRIFRETVAVGQRAMRSLSSAANAITDQVAALGDGDKAAEPFSLLNPINHSRTRADAYRYKVEPCAVCADNLSTALTGAVAARSRVEAGIDDAAARFIQRARRVAESLELGIAGAHGVMLAKGERYTIDELGRDESRESEART